MKKGVICNAENDNEFNIEYVIPDSAGGSWECPI